jgi:hypothetical protein
MLGICQENHALSKEAALKKNLLAALEMASLDKMHRWVN